MKKFLYTIATLVAGTLIGIFFNRIFSDKPTPEIVYALSNPTYTTLDENTERESLQELVIRNEGTETAERIIVYANRPISNYEIKKYSLSDSIKVTQNVNEFELIYPTLPKSGEIKILLRNINRPVSLFQLQIKIDNGSTESVIQKENNKIFSLGVVIVALICISGYAIYAFMTISNKVEKAIVHVNQVIEARKKRQEEQHRQAKDTEKSKKL